MLPRLPQQPQPRQREVRLDRQAQPAGGRRAHRRRAALPGPGARRQPQEELRGRRGISFKVRFIFY